MPYAQIPPFQVTRVFLEAEAVDRLDWGQEGMPTVWQRATGEGVKVGIVDTGIDRRHVTGGDLVGSVAGGRNFTGRGDIDDFWDSPYDGHGSHVAGIIGGRRDFGPIVGYAPDCSLLIARALYRGGGDMAAIAAAVRWLVDQGADVINMSLGGPYDDPGLRQEVMAAAAAGVFVICAAGNEGGVDTVGFPGRYPESVAIGAVDSHGNIAPYSSRGPQVAFVAPGSQITSCWLDGGHATINGTSMAAPAITGAVACLIQVHRELPGGGKTPLVTREQLIEHLARHAQDAGAPGPDPAGGAWGRPDFSQIGVDDAPDAPAPSPVVPGPASGWLGKLLSAVSIHHPPQTDDWFSVGPR